MIEIKIDSSKLNFVDVEKWWNILSVKDRLDFLNKNGWVDITWSKYKFDELHFGMKGWLNKKYSNEQV